MPLEGKRPSGEEGGFMNALFRWVTCTGGDGPVTTVSSREPTSPLTPAPPLGTACDNFDRKMFLLPAPACRGTRAELQVREFQLAGDHCIAPCLTLHHRHLLGDGRYISGPHTNNQTSEALKEWLLLAWQHQQHLRATQLFGKVAIHSWSEVIETFALSTQLSNESKENVDVDTFEMFESVEHVGSPCSTLHARRCLPVDELEAYRISALGMSDMHEGIPSRNLPDREVAYCLDDDELPLFVPLDLKLSDHLTIEYII